jgi:hypothetical protein
MQHNHEKAAGVAHLAAGFQYLDGGGNLLFAQRIERMRRVSRGKA